LRRSSCCSACGEGVVAGLRAELLEDPRAREIVSVVNRTLEPALFERLGAIRASPSRAANARAVRHHRAGESRSPRRGIARGIAANRGGRSAAAWPRVPGSMGWCSRPRRCRRLGLRVGEPVLASVARSRDGQREVLTLPMRVAGDCAALRRDARRRLRDHSRCCCWWRISSTAAQRRMRVPPMPRRHARAPLPASACMRRGSKMCRARRRVPRAGIEVASRAEAVAGLLRLDRNLALLFAAIAGAGGVGYLVSLGVGLWAQVERKRRDIALLSLLGMKRRALLALPIIQAAAVALAGAGMAFLLAAGVARVLNGAFAGTVTGDRPVCLLTAAMGFAAAGVTVAGAVIAAMLAGLRAAAVPPAQGLAEG
jgi:putative ABC transport system permease protein